MTVHTFGNTCSPAVANFCLRRTAEDGEEIFGSAAKEFVTSTPLDTDATSLVKNTQALLATTYIQLQGGFELHCCHGFPRCYHPNNFGQITCVELHAFSDASEDAIIGVTVYLKLVDKEERVSVSLILAQTKLALRWLMTIPRLELCAAVLTTQATRRVLKELTIEVNEVVFYSDSKVVLGYIQNEKRRFYSYVANWVQIIRQISSPTQRKADFEN